MTSQPTSLVRRALRWVVVTLAWLTVGTILSLASAVVCCLRADQSSAVLTTARRPPLAGATWLWPARPGWADPDMGHDEAYSSTLFRERYWRVGQGDGRRVTQGGQQELSAGWPVLAWCWRRDWSPTDPEPVALFDAVGFKVDRGFGGIYWFAPPRGSWAMAHVVTFPVTPRGAWWVVSVVGYGVVAWGLARVAGWGWGWRRERRRRREGGCRGCYYPVRGMDRCPECGVVVDRTLLG